MFLTPVIGIYLLKDPSVSAYVLQHLYRTNVYKSSMKNQNFGSLHVVNILQPICTHDTYACLIYMDRIQCTYCILGSNNLAGAIPPQIVELKVITVFNLSSNKLHGADPQSICNLFFFLEYAGELCIFVLRRRKDPITETISPLDQRGEEIRHF